MSYYLCFVFLFGALLSSCSLEDTSQFGLEEDQGEYIDRSELPWYWDDHRLPLDFVYSEDFETTFSDHFGSNRSNNNPIEESLAIWDDAIPSVQLFETRVNSISNKQFTDLDDYRDDEMGIYIHREWFSDSRPNLDTALAITILFTQEMETYYSIVHIDILVNFSIFSPNFNTFDQWHHDLQSILIHEVGHSLGLSHIPYVSSVMYKNLASDEVKRTLSNYDVNSINEAYDSYFSLRNSGAKGAGPKGRPDYYDDASLYDRDELVRFIIALYPDGKCRHFIDKKTGLSLLKTHSHIHSSKGRK